jgi:hypothetical protein
VRGRTPSGCPFTKRVPGWCGRRKRRPQKPRDFRILFSLCNSIVKAMAANCSRRSANSAAMESGKSRSLMAKNDQIRNAAWNMGGQHQARDLAELAVCNRPGAYQRRFVRRCSEVSICHERILCAKAPCLDLVVPATSRHRSQTGRVHAVVVLRICLAIGTDARRRRARIGEILLAPTGHRADDPCSSTLSNKAASASSCRCVSPKPRPNRFPRSLRPLGEKRDQAVRKRANSWPVRASWA